MNEARNAHGEADVERRASVVCPPRRLCVPLCVPRVTEDLRQSAERVLGHVFADAALLEEALTHTSAADTRLRSNERMEFLGDAVLDLVVVDALYREFPDYFEGDLTKVKSAVVSRRTCAAVARDIGLDELLIVGKGMEGRHHIPASLTAAVYESIVAALYLDGGYEVAKRFVLDTMTPHVKSLSANLHQHNYKALLQQHAQRLFSVAPQYELLDEKGPDHSKCFEICVSVEGKRFEGAWAPTKKVAEQKAAVNALRDLDLIGEDEHGAAVQVLDQLAPTTA